MAVADVWVEWRMASQELNGIPGAWEESSVSAELATLSLYAEGYTEEKIRAPMDVSRVQWWWSTYNITLHYTVLHFLTCSNKKYFWMLDFISRFWVILLIHVSRDTIMCDTWNLNILCLLLIWCVSAVLEMQECVIMGGLTTWLEYSSPPPPASAKCTETGQARHLKAIISKLCRDEELD